MKTAIPSWPILALALACFAIGTTEFVIVGILPDVASGLGVSLSIAGFLVTGYAVGVAIGGPVVVWWTSRWPRKRLLLSLLMLFIAGNLVSGFAQGYWVLMAGRLLASFAHGAFFGIGAAVATDLVPQEQRGAAIALMFSGLTLANVLGVPVGTVIGQTYGWRSTFLVVSLLGVFALGAVALLLPSACKGQDGQKAGGFVVLVRPRLLLALLLTVFSFGGVFTAFTFVTPMLVDVAGLSPRAAAATLFLFGAGMTLGNTVGGRLADRKLLPSLLGVLICLAALELLFSFVLPVASLAVAVVFAWGFAAFCAVPGLQTNVVNEAPAGVTAFASTLNVSAFNVGNAAGAWMGSALVAADIPLRWLPSYAAIAAIVAAALALLSMGVQRRKSPPQPLPQSTLMSAGDPQ